MIAVAQDWDKRLNSPTRSILHLGARGWGNPLGNTELIQT